MGDEQLTNRPERVNSFKGSNFQEDENFTEYKVLDRSARCISHSSILHVVSSIARFFFAESIAE